MKPIALEDSDKSALRLPAAGPLRGGDFQSSEDYARASQFLELGCRGGGGHIGCMADAEMKLQESKHNVWRWLWILFAIGLAASVIKAIRLDALGLSWNVREAVGKNLGKEVSALTTGDYAMVTSLVLRASRSVYLTLPAPLGRWQHLIPIRTRTIMDADLKNMRNLTGLHRLNLYEAQVTDEGMPYLIELSALEALYLDDTRVTDIGLLHLAMLPALQELSLSSTSVTDAGLMNLAKVPALVELNLNRTRVTDEGMERFKEERKKAGLPECTCERSDFDTLLHAIQEK